MKKLSKKYLLLVSLTIILMISLISFFIGNKEDILNINRVKRIEGLSSVTKFVNDQYGTNNVSFILRNIEDITNETMTGTRIKITSSANLKLQNPSTNNYYESNTVDVSEDGLIIALENIEKGQTYNVEIENLSRVSGYEEAFKKIKIEIDYNNENDLTGRIKELKKEVDGTITNVEINDDNNVIFLFTNEDNKIEFLNNPDVEIVYTYSVGRQLSNEELENAVWETYKQNVYLQIEKNGYLYSKSKYKNNTYSKPSFIKVDNIDKLDPKYINYNKTGSEEKYTLKFNIVDEDENEEYGKSGIDSYYFSDVPTIPETLISADDNALIEKTVECGTSYYLTIKDKAGNKKQYEFEDTITCPEDHDPKVLILSAPNDELIGTSYEDLTSLIDVLNNYNVNAESGEVVVQIEKNIVDESVEINDKNIKIDLNGYSITSRTNNKTFDVKSGSILKIVDNKYDIKEFFYYTSDGIYIPEVVSDYEYKGYVEEYNVESTGLYKLETWGAQGGYAISSSKAYGGYGGYSVGFASLEENDTLSVVVGGQGESIDSAGSQVLNGGYNGGGASQNNSSYTWGAGGGATHIAKKDDSYTTLASYGNSETATQYVYIVSGAGGGGGYYSSSSNTYSNPGGSGGGYLANSGNGSNPGNGGSQTAGGAGTYASIISGSFGTGGGRTNNTAAGGGAGWYGGGTAYYNGSSAGGGSGYINVEKLEDAHMYCFNCQTSNALSTYTKSGGEKSCHSNTASKDCSKEGNGYAKITKMKFIERNYNYSNFSHGSGNGSVKNTTDTAINVEENGVMQIGEDNSPDRAHIEFPDHDTPNIYGKNFGIKNNGTLNYYDGVIAGKTAVDGNINDAPPLYDPSVVKQSDDTYKMTLDKVSNVEALIGKTRYSLLEDAIDAANNRKGTPEDQITIDIETDLIKDHAIEISNTKNIILNLNGYDWTTTETDYVIKNYGKLVIDDPNDGDNIGKVSSGQGSVIYNAYGSEITINNGDFEIDSGNYTLIYNDVNSKLTINGGNFRKYNSFYISANPLLKNNGGIVNINGGKFYASCGGEYAFNILDNNDAIYETDLTDLKNYIVSENQSSSTYNFEENSMGYIVNNNQGVKNTISSMYYEIDLTEYPNYQKFQIELDASISSELNGDYASAHVTTSSTKPNYYDSNKRFMYISGETEFQKYTFDMDGGNKYYLHIQYYKNNNNIDFGDDTLYLRSIKLRKYDDYKGILNINDYSENVSKDRYATARTILNSSHYDGVIINGGNISWNIFNRYDGILTINDGIFKGNIRNDYGTINANGGTFDGTISNERDSRRGTINITGGYYNYIYGENGNIIINEREPGVLTAKNIRAYNYYKYNPIITINGGTYTGEIENNYKLSISNAFVEGSINSNTDNETIVDNITINRNNTNSYNRFMYQKGTGRLVIKNSKISYYFDQKDYTVSTTTAIEKTGTGVVDIYDTDFDMQINDTYNSTRSTSYVGIYAIYSNAAGNINLINTNIKTFVNTNNNIKVYGIYNLGSGDITFGEKDGDYLTDEYGIESTSIAMYSPQSNVKLYDGYFFGKTAITGLINDVEDNYSIVKENIDDKEKIYLSNDLSNKTVEWVEEGIQYRTLGEALASIQNNEATLKVLNELYVTESEDRVIDENQTITLDLNGKLLHIGSEITNNGTLNIIDNSSDVARIETKKIINNGNMNIQSGDWIFNINNYVGLNNYGELSITNSIIESTYINTNESILSNYGTLNVGENTKLTTNTYSNIHAVYNHEDAIFNMNDGEIVTNGQGTGLAIYNVGGTTNINGGNIHSNYSARNTHYLIYNTSIFTGEFYRSDGTLENVQNGIINLFSYSRYLVVDLSEYNTTDDIKVEIDYLDKLADGDYNRVSLSIKETSSFETDELFDKTYEEKDDNAYGKVYRYSKTVKGGYKYYLYETTYSNSYSIPKTVGLRYYINDSSEPTREYFKRGLLNINGGTFSTTYYGIPIHSVNADIKTTGGRLENIYPYVYGIYLQNYSTLETNGLEIDKYEYGIYTSESKITIKDINIINVKHGINGNSNINIEDGTIQATDSGVYTYSDTSKLKITGGTITGSNYGIYVGNGNVPITLGENDDEVSTTTPVIVGTNNYGIYNPYGTTNYYDGIIKGKNTIYGSIADRPEEYELFYGTEDALKTVILKKLIIATNVDTNVNYSSLQKVIDECPNNEICNIQIQYDLALPNIINVQSDKNIVIDLNGKLLSTSVNKNIKNNGILTIKNGTIDVQSTGNDERIIDNYGILNINENAKLTTNSLSNVHAVYNHEDAIFNMNDGEIVTNGQGTGLAIYNEGGTTNINGGNIHSIYTYNNANYLIYNTSIFTGEFYRSEGTLENIQNGIINSFSNTRYLVVDLSEYDVNDDVKVEIDYLDKLADGNYNRTSLSTKETSSFEPDELFDKTYEEKDDNAYGKVYRYSKTVKGGYKYYLYETTYSNSYSIPKTVGLRYYINDSSEPTREYFKRGLLNLNGGILNITGVGVPIYSINADIKTTGGTMANTSPNSSGIYVKNYSTLETNGLEIDKFADAIYTSESKVTIKDINITNSRYGINGNSNINIEGGTIQVTDSGVYTYSDTSKLKITGGTITGSNYGIYVGNGNVPITLGENDDEVSTTTPVIVGTNNYGIYNPYGTTNYYDGIIKGKETIYGSIADRPEEYELLHGTDNELKTESLSRIHIVNNKDTSTEYSSLQDAINECPNNETCNLEMLYDTYLPKVINIPLSKNIILDLNDKKIVAAKDKRIVNNGSLKIVNGNMELQSGGNNDSIIENFGTLEIGNNTIISTNIYSFIHAIHNREKAILNITGGELKTSSNNSNNSNNVGTLIYNEGGTVNISGGKIYSTNNGISNFIYNTSKFLGEYHNVSGNNPSTNDGYVETPNNSQKYYIPLDLSEYSGNVEVSIRYENTSNSTSYLYITEDENFPTNYNTATLVANKNERDGLLKLTLDGGKKYYLHVQAYYFRLKDITIGDNSLFARGTINISGGTIQGYSNNQEKIRVVNGDLYISDGTITSTNLTNNSGARGIYLKNDANLYITGGTIENQDPAIDLEHETAFADVKNSIITGYYNQINVSYGTLNLASNVTSTNRTAVYGYGYSSTKYVNVNILGGTITSNNDTAVQFNNNVVLNVGKNDGYVSTTSPNIYGKNYGVNVNSSVRFNYYDGIITSPNKTINGTVNEIPQDYEIVVQDETSNVLRVLGTLDSTFQANGVYYATINEAINAITSQSSKTGTINIGNDVIFDNSFTIPEGVNITLSLNGHSLEFDNVTTGIINNGTLTIIDGYEDELEDEINSIINENGTAIENNGTLTIGESYAVNKNSPYIEGNVGYTGNKPTMISGRIKSTSDGSILSYILALLNPFKNFNTSYAYDKTTYNVPQNIALTSSPIFRSTATVGGWTNQNVLMGISSGNSGILNVYNTLSEKEVKYKVDFYKNNVKVDDDSYEVSKSIAATSNEIPVDSISNLDNKYINYDLAEIKLNGTKVDSLPTTVSENDVISIYYQEQPLLSYKVEFYKIDALNNETKVEEFTRNEKKHIYDEQKINVEAIDNLENRYEYYNLEKIMENDSVVDSLPSKVSDNTIIKIYYKITSETKMLNYKVEYYHDNVKVNTTTETKEVPVYENDELDVNNTTFNNIDTKYDNYDFIKIEQDNTEISKDNIPDKVLTDTVFKVYYEKQKDIKYTVEFYKDNVKFESYDVTKHIHVWDDETIDVESIDNIENKYDYFDYIKMTLNNTEINELPNKLNNNDVIKIYYQAQRRVKYTVEFYKGNTLSDTYDVQKYIHVNEEEKLDVESIDNIDNKYENYDFVKMTLNNTEISELPNKVNNNDVIKLYYKVSEKMVKYKVEFYKNDILDESSSYTVEKYKLVTENDKVSVDQIDNIDTKYVYYDFEKMKLNNEEITELPTTVNNNDVIKLYYKNQEKEVNYFVEVYFNDELSEDDSYEVKKYIPKWQDNDILVNADAFENIETKYEGFTFIKMTVNDEEKSIIPTSVSSSSVIKLYYEGNYKVVNYRVEFYKDDVIDEVNSYDVSKTVDKNVELFEVDAIDNLETKYENYTFKKITLDNATVDNLPDYISDGSVIKIYYVNNSGLYKKLRYSVEVYKNDVLDKNESYTVEKLINVDDPDEIELELAAFNDLYTKYKAYYLTRVTNNGEITTLLNTIVRDGTTIRLYYEANKNDEINIKFENPKTIENNKNINTIIVSFIFIISLTTLLLIIKKNTKNKYLITK